MTKEFKCPVITLAQLSRGVLEQVFKKLNRIELQTQLVRPKYSKGVINYQPPIYLRIRFITKNISYSYIGYPMKEEG
jgi:hypothetical protein